MALINKLEAIGDAIRSKTGETAEMTLEEMATAITNLSLDKAYRLRTATFSRSSKTTFDLSNWVEPTDSFWFFYTFTTGGDYMKAIFISPRANNQGKSVTSLNSNTVIGSQPSDVESNGIKYVTNSGTDFASTSQSLLMINSAPSTSWKDGVLSLTGYNGAEFGVNGLLLYIGED